MVQLQLRLATTAEDSIKTITEQLKSFSENTLDPIHVSETDEVTFDFEVASDDVYQALGNQCQAWTAETNPTVIAYTMVRG
jgi:hypothetical protein